MDHKTEICNDIENILDQVEPVASGGNDILGSYKNCVMKMTTAKIYLEELLEKIQNEKYK